MKLRKTLVVIALVMAFVGMFCTTSFAAKFNTWNDMVDAMQGEINKSYTLYAAGDVDGAKAQVDVAYFQYYEKLGFEKTVLAYISGDRAAKVEYQFSFAKKAMINGQSNAEVKASLDKLTTMLREDANQLDGRKESALGVFLASLLIIVREGFEAIIIVGAILAYLVKSGHKSKVKPVYWGVVFALILSVVMAFALNALKGFAGANQEIVEGVTMLIAVVVLVYVSNWMVSKAETEAWVHYIEGQVAGSITTGNVFSLAFASFLI